MTDAPRRISLLVADDEQGFLDLYRYALGPEGFEVTAVGDGEAAVKAVTERAFDLVILDVHMPRMTGPEALVEMRRVRPCQRVMIVSSSSDPSNAQEQQAIQQGAAGCLFKPIELDELLGAIGRALDSRAHPSTRAGARSGSTAEALPRRGTP